MTNTRPIYRNSLPIQFYGFRGMLLGGLIFLFLIRNEIDYRFILVYLFLAFISSWNRDNYIIEVYNDRFNLVLPSIYGNRFTDTQTYYFSSIKTFAFEKGYYDWKAAIFGEILRFFLPVHMVGILFAYKNPTIHFTIEAKDFNIKFSYNQDSLVKALELIDKKIK